MKAPGHFPAIACAFALGVGGAHSAGIAALKEQPYHEDASASAVVFTRIFDSNGPYLRIVNGSTDIDILRTKLVGRIELPDGVPDSILEETDAVPLRATLISMKEFSARYPRSAPLLEKQATAVAGHLRRFEAGEVRFEGAWISRKEFAAILETRRLESEARERAEVEKRVFEASQRGKGLVLHDGKWLTKQEIERIPPEAPTELSSAIEPLANSDLEGAKSSVNNLGSLASHQTGAAKVRTERLQIAIRNLFIAESRYRQQVIARAGGNHEAALHDKNAKEWLKPNAFGTVSEEAVVDSRDRAREIRKRTAEDMAAARQMLLDQLHEMDVVTGDFHHLREHRVALIVGNTVRTVAARHFTRADFQPSFPEATLTAIRQQVTPQ